MEPAQGGERNWNATWRALDHLSVPRLIPGSLNGQEMSVWRALMLTRERTSAAALADRCT